MPDVMITLLFGCALGFGIGYAVRERVLVSATAAIASEAFIRRSHLLPELRQVHSDF